MTDYMVEWKDTDDRRHGKIITGRDRKDAKKKCRNYLIHKYGERLFVSKARTRNEWARIRWHHAGITLARSWVGSCGWEYEDDWENLPTYLKEEIREKLWRSGVVNW
jgi:hypothetical protein